jgi:arginine-tRNA-protein transferase
MPFAQRILPDQFLADDFDEAWARGWFRMRQSLFTTHFLEFERKIFAALWLRVGLLQMVPDKKFLALKKLNRGFRAEFRPSPLLPPPDHEALYQIYRRSLSFEPAPNLGDLLLGAEPRSLFPTWQVEVFDGETLAAAGYFDMGNRAAAGIVSFYDPAYKKNSLGKYLIYLKMEFCQNRGLEYFYPGYLAPGEFRFDYKRQMGAATLEYLELASGLWRSYPRNAPVFDPLADMTARLERLRDVLAGEGLVPRFYRYLHLDINLNPQVQGAGLFDFPVFLDCVPTAGTPPILVAVFEPRNGQYQLFHCQSVYRFGQEEEADVFESDLLMVERVLFSTPVPEEMAACLNNFTIVQRS